MNTKKTIVLFCAFILATNILSGCFWQSEDSPTHSPEMQEAIAKPFTMDFEIDEDVIDFYINNTSFDDIVDGGPYYISSQNPIQPLLIEYEKLKTEKVNEAIDITEKIFNQAKEVKSHLDQLKNDFIYMMDLALEHEKDLKDASKEFGKIILEYQILEELLIMTYESIEVPTDDDVLKARFEYLKTNLAVELQEVIVDDLEQFTTLAILLYFEFVDSNDEVIVDIATKFMQDMEIINELSEIVWDMQDNVINLDFILKQINTAEYYIGLASLDYIQNEIPEIRKLLDNADENEVLNLEDIEFLKEYLDIYDDFSKDLIVMLEDIDEKYLLDIDTNITLQNNYYFPKATAQGRDYSQRSLSIFTSNEPIGQKMRRVPGLMLDNMKDGLRQARQSIGAAVEGANMLTKTTFDYGLSWWYGNDVKDTQAILDENGKALRARWENDELGADVYQQAIDYFDYTDSTGQAIADQGVQALFGEGNLSWLAGHTGRITVGMFTGFGKGTMQILNPRSSGGELAEGLLSVSLSLIGGSKVIFKGSQVASGGAKSLRLAGQKSINALERFLASGHIKNLKRISSDILQNKKLTKEMARTLINNAKRISRNTAIQQKLQAVSQSINQQFLDLMKQGGRTFLTNMKKGSKEAYKEFMQQAFEHSLSGYKDALIGVLGNSFTEYINNLVASKADDMFKTMVKEYIDKGLIPGLGGPFDGNYVGKADILEYNIPISFTIEDNILDGRLDFSSASAGSINLVFSGSVTEEGVLYLETESGQLKFRSSDMNLDCSVTGRGHGNIATQSFVFNVTQLPCTGTFWGQEIDPSDGLNLEEGDIEPISFTFNEV